MEKAKIKEIDERREEIKKMLDDVDAMWLLRLIENYIRYITKE